MTVALAALPLLLVIGLLASGRVSALTAGAAGLVASVGVAAVSGTRGVEAFASFALAQTGIGAWLSWQVIATLLGGVFLHRSMQARAAPATTSAAPPDDATRHRRLYFVCFMLGPFAECVTGFGVGYIIALAAIVRLGIGGVPALLLGLYSQSLVPWGALAIGTSLGSVIGGIDPSRLGTLCALLQIPIHVGYLLLFWRFRADAGQPVPSTRKLDDALWTAAIVASVWAAHRLIDVEIAGAAPLGLLCALRWWRDERPDAATAWSTARRAAPYIALTLALVLTRTVPPLQDALRQAWAWRPIAGQPAFAPFYAPGFWLFVVGLGTLLVARAPVRPTIGAAVLGAWRPSAVTLMFVTMAAFYVAGGMAGAIADALHAAVGPVAALATPLFAAVGGFLTGSGAGSNAMLMPMQVALASRVGLPADWIAAVQNGVTANLTMLSPIRVSMGVAILALAGGDSAIYRRAWPLALPPVVTGLLAIAAALATR